jgi:diguanylate cyclase (GGDEF)-like protein
VRYGPAGIMVRTPAARSVLPASPASAGQPRSSRFGAGPMTAGVVLLTAGYLVWTRLSLGGAAATVAFSDIFIGLINIAAGLACLFAGRRVSDRRGRGWWLIGAGMLAWAFGEVVWTGYEVLLGVEVPFPSLADVGFLAMVPLVLAGMASMLEFRAGGLRSLLDGLVVACSLLCVAWPTVLEPTYQAGGQNLLARSIALAYPIGDIAVASMVLVLLSQTSRRARGPLALAATGMLAVAAADIGFAYLTLHDTYVSGSVVDPGWVVGFLLVGVAGLRAPAAAADPGTLRTTPLLVALPYVPLTAALATSIAVEVARGSIGTFLYLTFTVLVTLVVLRQLVTLRENLRLTRVLDATVTDLRRQEEQLRHLAFHDPLTGLANRALFQHQTEHAIDRRRRDPAPLGIIYLDLDGFKQVNDSSGHPVGDALLVAVGRRLRENTRPGDTVARLGGDEFAMLLDGMHAETDAGRLADRLVTTLAEPFDLDGRTVQVSASVGIAVQPAGECHGGELLRDADLAMYAAKLGGKARSVPFEPQLRNRLTATPGPGGRSAARQQ